MRAREIADDYPIFDLDTNAVQAVRALVEQKLPGLVVTDAKGVPHSVLPASEVLRLMVPAYVQEDPALARVFGEKAADQVAARLSGRTVGELLPKPPADLSTTDPEATVVVLAELMIRMYCPIVAVVEDDRVLGVVTMTRLMELILPKT